MKKEQEDILKKMGEIASSTDFLIVRVPEGVLSKDNLIKLLCDGKDSFVDESEIEVDEIDDPIDRLSLMFWLGEDKK